MIFNRRSKHPYGLPVGVPRSIVKEIDLKVKDVNELENRLFDAINYYKEMLKKPFKNEEGELSKLSQVIDS